MSNYYLIRRQTPPQPNSHYMGFNGKTAGPRKRLAWMNARGLYPEDNVLLLYDHLRFLIVAIAFPTHISAPADRFWPQPH